MITLPSLTEGIRKHRLISLTAWHDRIVVWGAAALAGLCVVGFTLLTEGAINLFKQIEQRSMWLPLAILPPGAMAIVWATRRFAPAASGSGIPQVMSALDTALTPAQTRSLVSLKLSAFKALLGSATLLIGFSAGREGPAVQIAAGIMTWFRTSFGPRSVVHSRDLLLAGGAAGIAAAFNAPLAGVVFAIEELSRRFEQRSSGLITTAIIISGVVSISLLGNYTYFGRMRVDTIGGDVLWAGIVCAILAGLLGGLFSRVLLLCSMGEAAGRLGGWRERRPILFAGGCGLAVAVLGIVSGGTAYGSGYQYTRDLLAGAGSVPLLFVVVKFVATWLSYWSGVPGGIFAPCLAIGAGLGNDVATLGHLTSVVPLIALGMVGFLAAVTQAPITSFIIVMEMIDGHAMVLSLMATALAASLVSRMISPPLYGALAQLTLARMGVVSEQHS